MMFFKNVFSYSLVNFYAQIVRLLQELGVRFLLPPEVLGLWSLVLVIQNACLSFDWGILTAASRELPLLYGAGRFQAAADYRRTVFHLHVLGKLLISLGVLIYGAYYYLFPFQPSFMAVFAAAMIFFVSGIGEAFISFYQSAQQYVTLSKKLFFYWTCYSLMMLAGAYCWAVKGLILAAVLSLILQTLLLHNSMDYAAVGRYTRHYIKSILGFALPFRAVDFPISLAATLDAVLVARYFDLKVLAIYTTAKLIFNQAGQVPTWIGSVFISRMTTLAGSTNSRDQLGREMLINLTALNLLLLPFLIGLVALSAYWGVLLWLPQYSEAVVVLPVLLISLYFQPRVTVIRNYWIIEKKFGWIGLSNLLVLGAMVTGFAALYFFDSLSLEHVALVYTGSFCLYFIFVLVRLGMELWGLKRWLCFMMETLAVLLALIFAIQYAGLLKPLPSYSNALFAILQSVGRFMEIMGPVMIYGVLRVSLSSRQMPKTLAAES